MTIQEYHNFDKKVTRYALLRDFKKSPPITSPRDSASKCDIHGALGKSPKLASTSSKHETRQTKNDNFKTRLKLQDEVKRLVPDSRTGRMCLRLKIPTHDYVTVSTTNDSAHFGGLAVCDNIWACPVCSAKIWARRGLELERGLSLVKAQGYSVTMLTFTLSHTYTDSLESLNSDLMSAYKFMWSGREGQAIKKSIGYVGSIKVYETIHGDSSGWHPHLHILFITESPLSESYPQYRVGATESGCEFSIETLLKNRWIHSLKKFGRSASFEHGLNFADSDKEIFEYITKQSNLVPELTNGHNKKSRLKTPIQLLAESAEGDKKSSALWCEYYRATHRLKAMVYSKGLKELLEISESDESDETTESESAVYAMFEPDLWRDVMRLGGAGTRSRILWIAGNESVYHLALFLHRSLGIAWSRAVSIFPVQAQKMGISKKMADWDILF